MVQMLQHFKVDPVLVFDGATLPAKVETNLKRREGRTAARGAAASASRELSDLKVKLSQEIAIKGPRKATLEDAVATVQKAFEEACQRCAEVKHEHVVELIAQLRSKNVEFLVAPYEADAQLAFLSAEGLVDAVLTEDSDLLAYGCDTVLLKLDRNTGDADEIKLERMADTRPPFALHHFDKDMFTEMCILCGVDYLPSPKGLGVMKARQEVARLKHSTKVIRSLRQSKGIDVPPGYEEHFRRAFLTFRCQRVYDPKTQTLRPLSPLAQEALALEEAELETAIGPSIPDEVARGIAIGRLDPKTQLPVGVKAPSSSVLGMFARCRERQALADEGHVAEDATPRTPPRKRRPARIAQGSADKEAAAQIIEAAIIGHDRQVEARQQEPAPHHGLGRLVGGAGNTALGDGHPDAADMVDEEAGEEVGMAPVVDEDDEGSGRVQEDARELVVNPFGARGPSKTTRPALGAIIPNKAACRESAVGDPTGPRCWQCPHCRASNTRAAQVCCECHRIRAATGRLGRAVRGKPGSAQPASWACVHCSMENEARACVCAACSRLHMPQRSTLAAPRSGEADALGLAKRTRRAPGGTERPQAGKGGLLRFLQAK